MCGIFGAFQTRPLDPTFIDKAKQATDQLSHRGPDARGDYLNRDHALYFGHRRLKIIDLSDLSAQPMLCGDVALTYNGEVYNFQSIKDRLTGLGHVFQSSGDTEVVLKAWRQWGPDCLNEFDGMFAFSLWDGECGWLAVDPFSEKQIYYSQSDEGIVFSSELQVLADFIDAKADVKTHIHSLLSLGYISAPQTVYPKIKRVSPGSCIKIQNGCIVAEYNYWTPAAPANQTTDRPDFTQEALEEVRNILIENVSSRLISDVPRCLFLSSGMDSALIAAITRRELDQDIDAITVGFAAGETNDESDGAREIAKALGLSHHVLPGSDPSGVLNPQKLLSLYGQPNANVTIASVEQMARAAQSSGYRVGLTGLGGDELFFGYEKQAFAYRYKALYNLPQFLRKSLGLLTGPIGRASGKARAFNAFMALSDNERIPALKMPMMIQTLRSIPGFDSWCQDRYPSDELPFELTVARVEMMDTMVNSQLPAIDIGSMRASMELRTPFLSRQLCDFMSQWNWGNIMSHGRKRILRKLLTRYLPQKMFDKKKMGFVFPVDLFLQQFDAPPEDLPYLPNQLRTEIWNRRAEPDWRVIANRTLVTASFYQQMNAAGRIADKL